MKQLVNQYSFVVVGVFILAATVLLALRFKSRWQELLAIGVVAAALVTAWLVLHPLQTPRIQDAQSVRAMIGQGKPVLLEFQSPY